ncbi:hydrogenase maturation protease [Litorivivens sp.]|uniref:hydrogenase maturation protease n=1 Tax=Litorivivens sp. TaxID=2020868 RepID=UPI0035698D65
MSECKLKNPGPGKAEDTSPFTAIIACGNSNRSDDGVASYVVQQLSSLPARADIRLFDTGTNGMEVMFKARGCSTLILIDASDSGQAPGTLCKVPGAELERIPEPGLNLHNFRWENAVYAGQRIFGDEFPNDISVYLIEAENLGLGLTLSDTVRAAADRLCEQLSERYWPQDSTALSRADMTLPDRSAAHSIYHSGKPDV